MSIALVMPSSHLIICRCLFLLPSIFPSIRDFSKELAVRIRWPKYWSFSFSISPSNEFSGLISRKIDWFDLLAVQGPLRSLLQHHSQKASFFGAPPSLRSSSLNHTWPLGRPQPGLYGLVSGVMSLLFNLLSRFVIAMLPRSNCLLISWLHSPSAEILELKERKFVTTSTFSPSVCHEVIGLDAMILLLLIFVLALGWLFHFPPSPSSRGSLVPLCFLLLGWYHLRIWGCWFLLPILIPACNSSSLAFIMMCSLYRLSEQGGSRQPCRTPFSVLNESFVLYRVLTVASWYTYRFLRRQLRSSLNQTTEFLWESKNLKWNLNPYPKSKVLSLFLFIVQQFKK